MYTILTVDDSPMTRAMIRRTIGMSGVPVARLIEAADGQAGLDALLANPVDLVLADINMPVMDGLEMIRRYAAAPGRRDVPILVISADSGEQRRAELTGLGVRGFLTKPFTPEKLRDLFTAALGAAHV
jgi:two-component system chemotaxis response regulator CheY